MTDNQKSLSNQMHPLCIGDQHAKVTNPEQMVIQEVGSTHQLAGTEGSHACHSDLLKEQSTVPAQLQLNPTVFPSINIGAHSRSTGLPLVSQGNFQLRFCFWNYKRGTWGTDAFCQDCAKVKEYANPPWHLLGRCHGGLLFLCSG